MNRITLIAAIAIFAVVMLALKFYLLPWIAFNWGWPGGIAFAVSMILIGALFDRKERNREDV
jgi:hypothetical protein